MLITEYHSDDGTYDIVFMDGGLAFSVPRHLIATRKECQRANAKYEEKRQAAGDAGENSSDEGGEADGDGKSDTSNRSEERTAAVKKQKREARKKQREAGKKAHELSLLLEKHRTREPFAGVIARIRNDKPLHSADSNK